MRILFLALCSCFFWQSIHAQDGISEKMKWYSMAKPTSNLFVHFDKNIYNNNETIWFTGYLLKESKIPIAKHRMMSVMLVGAIDSAIVVEDKFLMDNGISFGSIKLPDSIPTGKYHILVYTDKLFNGSPEALFIQSITIKTNLDPPFKASIKIDELANGENKMHKVLIAATTKDSRFLPKPVTINYRYGNISKTAKSDAYGRLLLNLPLQNNIADPNIYVKLKNGKDSSSISMVLPSYKNKASVKFYPEGGQMVAGISSTINWEVKNQQNMPVALKAYLYINKELIDTIKTSANGIGKFKLIPVLGASYTVKLVQPSFIDSTYYLPKAIEKGLVISIANAVAQDTIRLTLKAKGVQKINILVHNFRDAFLKIPFEMGLNSRTVKFPLTEVPKGLNTITILDSLNRPLAERMFFAHYDNREKITISTSKPSYQPREKITLKLKLNTEKKGLISIACVQDSRLDPTKMNDIESYVYLKNELDEIPVHIKGSVYQDRAFLEQVLSVKGWRKYTWQEFEHIVEKDTLTQSTNLNVTGKVSKLRKELTEPLIVGTIGNTQINMIKTDQKGFFIFNPEEMVIVNGKKMYAFVNNREKLGFETKIIVNDAYATMNSKLIRTIKMEDQIAPSTLQDNAELVLKNNEKAIRLKEVVITNTNGSSKRYGSNACGDYVCPYNILNCINHVGYAQNTQPVEGEKYLTSGRLFMYPGCAPPDLTAFWLVKGVHLQKEFYVNDYKDPLEPAYFSTLYWNYGKLIEADKEIEVSFYSSDITGRYKVIVQGIVANGVIYGEKYFEVKPN